MHALLLHNLAIVFNQIFSSNFTNFYQFSQIATKNNFRKIVDSLTSGHTSVEEFLETSKCEISHHSTESRSNGDQYQTHKHTTEVKKTVTTQHSMSTYSVMRTLPGTHTNTHNDTDILSLHGTKLGSFHFHHPSLEVGEGGGGGGWSFLHFKFACNLILTLPTYKLNQFSHFCFPRV